jgi:hypothetical protein
MTRNVRDPLLDVFDYPDGFLSTVQRNATTTATQSLVMLNSPFVNEQAQHWSRLVVRVSPEESARLDAAFRSAFARFPTESERASLRRLLRSGEASAWRDVCHVLLNTNEFVTID